MKRLFIKFACFALLQPLLANADSQVAVPWTGHLGLDAERWQLPDGEGTTFARMFVRQEVLAGLRFGVDSFAAVRGKRGGFITLGVGGEYVQPLGGLLDLEAGLSVTAGGGRGGFALSGGGLLVRESLGVGFSANPWRLRAGISHVDFPEGGNIRSTQAYAGIERAFGGLETTLDAQSGRFRLARNAELGEVDLAVQGRQYRMARGSRTDAGLLQSDFGVVGVEWRGTLHGPWFYEFDAAGAARGQSSGYMQIFGGVGLRIPAGNYLLLDAGISVGAGGGGAVDTGGGMLLAGRVGMSLRVDSRNELRVGYERMRALDGHLESDGLSLGLSRRFGPESEKSVNSDAYVEMEVHALRLRTVAQEYHGRREDWATRAVPNIGAFGIQADYLLGNYWYLTGQGVSAWRGKSGAYMTGLVGAGLRLPLQWGLDLEGEFLAGAAGGGGVNVHSGAVGQLNLGVGREWAGGFGLHVSYGRLRSFQGGFDVDVLGVSGSYRTALLSGAR